MVPAGFLGVQSIHPVGCGSKFRLGPGFDPFDGSRVQSKIHSPLSPTLRGLRCRVQSISEVQGSFYFYLRVVPGSIHFGSRVQSTTLPAAGMGPCRGSIHSPTFHLRLAGCYEAGSPRTHGRLSIESPSSTAAYFRPIHSTILMRF